MPTIEAVVVSNVHAKTLARNPELKPVHANLGSSFFLYRSLISGALKQSDPKSAEEAALLLSELHKNFESYWIESFNPAISNGYRLGSDMLSDEFVQAAAGKHSGTAARQINKVSDKAFIQGYNAALNKNWERAVAWERISEAYGLDPAQMRKWVTGYPTDGYHPTTIPEPSRRSLRKLLFDRSERIAGHELWTALMFGRQAEYVEKAKEGVLPKNAQKVWVTAQDELVCEVCGPMDYRSVGVEDRFSTDNGEFYAPPVHINCRCEIELYLPDVVTKAMGKDKYDRDSDGKFASNESRRPGTNSPFIVSSEPKHWPGAEVLARRPSHQIPEEIDAKKEKQDAEELIGSLKNAKVDEEVLPYTKEETKTNEQIEAEYANAVSEHQRAQQQYNEQLEADRQSAIDEHNKAVLEAEAAEEEAANKQYRHALKEATDERRAAEISTLAEQRGNVSTIGRTSTTLRNYDVSQEGILVPRIWFPGVEDAEVGDSVRLTEQISGYLDDPEERQHLMERLQEENYDSDKQSVVVFEVPEKGVTAHVVRDEDGNERAYFDIPKGVYEVVDEETMSPGDTENWINDTHNKHDYADEASGFDVYRDDDEERTTQGQTGFGHSTTIDPKFLSSGKSVPYTMRAGTSTSVKRLRLVSRESEQPSQQPLRSRSSDE